MIFSLSSFLLLLYHYSFFFHQLTSFLNRSDIHEDLGVGTHQWQMCSELVEKNVRKILVNAYEIDFIVIVTVFP